MNVSSIVVRTKPAAVKSVIATLEASGLCEVFFSDQQGRIVVTLESETVDGEIVKLTAIQNLPDVLGADLVYAFSDEGGVSLLTDKTAKPAFGRASGAKHDPRFPRGTPRKRNLGIGNSELRPNHQSRRNNPQFPPSVAGGTALLPFASQSPSPHAERPARSRARRGGTAAGRGLS